MIVRRRGWSRRNARLSSFTSLGRATPLRGAARGWRQHARHYAAESAAQYVAFRSSEPPDPTLAEGTAMSTSLRFTGRTRYNTFLGVEGEAGKLLGIEHSDLAGAYGVAGARGDLGRLAFRRSSSRAVVGFATIFRATGSGHDDRRAARSRRSVAHAAAHVRWRRRRNARRSIGVDGRRLYGIHQFAFDRVPSLL